MNLKVVISVTALALGLGSASYAANNYVAPERIHCKMTDAGTLSCDDFNRLYLVEDTTTADFPNNKVDIFHFAEAAAYVDGNRYSVFFTFKNSKSKMANLKTVNTSMRPDLDKSFKWIKTGDYYTCKDIETQCPITNLPA